MPLYAWIIIGCVIILAVVIMIKLSFFPKTLSESEQARRDSRDIDKKTENWPDRKIPPGMTGWFSSNQGGKRKNKNIKKRRKHKK